MKVVINGCFGGFGLSYKAIMRYAELKGIKLYAFVDDGGFIDHKFKPYVRDENPFSIYYSKEPLNDDGTYVSKSLFTLRNIARNDKDLIKVVKELGEEANGSCANLKIIEIPDDIEYTISEYDGMESIHEKHRSWA